MRKLRETLRLHFDARLSYRQIARCLQLSIGAVSKYIALAKAAGLTWPLPSDLDDSALERLLTPGAASVSARRFAEPDYGHIHTELQRKGVTLQLLWEEYREAHPSDGYQFTQFTVLYRQWQAHLTRSMRQTHRAGEKLFVDFSGGTVAVLDPDTGVRQAQIFVAVLGASRYTYAEAVWTQSMPDFVGAHTRAFAFLGGAPALLVPDCLRAAVTTPCRYDPQTNRTYQEMAEHYATAILPARPGRPKDKAAVENAVLLVQRWILARLRHRTFVSLSDLNQTISSLLAELNAKPFKKLPGCRLSLFEALDRPVLRPLPPEPYRYGRWIMARVGVDYHVAVDGHYYSVPHALCRRGVEVRIGATLVEIFHNHTRVASHVRSSRVGAHTTLPEHMPKSHRAHGAWSVARLLEWASEVGPHCRQVVERILERKPHPEHGYRACLGLQRLQRRYSTHRLEAACQRTLAIDAPAYASIAAILKTGLDALPIAERADAASLDFLHENVRGAEYYEKIRLAQEDLPC